MKMWNRREALLTSFFIIIHNIVTVESSSGGPCLSYAQRQCEVEGSNLWTATHGKQMDQICSFFGQYHSCIVSHMSQCDYQPHEKALHQSDIVNHYVNSPYNCPNPDTNLDGIARQQFGSRNNSTFNTCHSFMLYIIVSLHVYSLFLK